MIVDRQIAENEARLRQLAGVTLTQTTTQFDARVEGDEGDLAQVVTDSEVASRLSVLRASLQAQVATALDQIALGRYGTCEDCKEEIPSERMEFLPETTRCVRCQAVRDRRAS